MSEEKQIEEMARACCWGGARDGQSCEECLKDSILKNYECEWKTRVAKSLFDAGYRKPIEAEWIKAGSGITERVICSNCKSEKGSFMRPPFCNQCGAKMKGK